VDRIGATSNIEVVPAVELTQACGDGHLERIVLRDVGTGEPRMLDVAA